MEDLRGGEYAAKVARKTGAMIIPSLPRTCIALVGCEGQAAS